MLEKQTTTDWEGEKLFAERPCRLPCPKADVWKEGTVLGQLEAGDTRITQRAEKTG